VMFNCRKISELLSTEEFRSAPLWTRVTVRLHLAMCRHCSRFERQMSQIRAAVGQSFSQQAVDPELESRIIQRLQS